MHFFQGTFQPVRGAAPLPAAWRPSAFKRQFSVQTDILERVCFTEYTVTVWTLSKGVRCAGQRGLWPQGLVVPHPQRRGGRLGCSSLCISPRGPFDLNTTGLLSCTTKTGVRALRSKEKLYALQPYSLKKCFMFAHHDYKRDFDSPNSNVLQDHSHEKTGEE